jgi:hypothetical protein
MAPSITPDMTLEDVADALIKAMERTLSDGDNPLPILKAWGPNGMIEAYAPPDIMTDDMVRAAVFPALAKLVHQHGCTHWAFGGHSGSPDCIFLQVGELATQRTLYRGHRIRRNADGSYAGLGENLENNISPDSPRASGVTLH